ncbi:MAG: hypothetical protein M1837_003014 [Sclerophora amabilis]|nr:MAG: hypothetical protein M1837_003014 [Sclerophora amabilis]
MCFIQTLARNRPSVQTNLENLGMTDKRPEEEYDAAVQDPNWGVKGTAKSLQHMSSSGQAAKDRRDASKTERAKASLLDAAKAQAEQEKTVQDTDKK